MPQYTIPQVTYSIEIDYSRDELIDDFAMDSYKTRYLADGEHSPQEAYARAAMLYADDKEHAQRMYDYASQHWLMFATPVLTAHGLPISCFLNYVGDNLNDLSAHYEENMFLSARGGGIGSYWGAVRTQVQGGKSSGMVPFLKVEDSLTLAVQQGSTRRGATAAYLDIDHPEIEEFIEVRRPSGADHNRRCLNLHNAINITDAFMALIEKKMKDPEADVSWDLIDPHTKQVTSTVDAWELWCKIIQTRAETGEPYIHFIDTSNRYLPEWLKDQGLRVNQSNLCSEIILPTSPERTAVCCLSSVNLENYEAWKETNMVQDLVRFLDNVLSSFINEADAEIYRAKLSAFKERSIGMGAMGFHAFLHKKGIPFDSVMAKSWNNKMFKHIREEAEIATEVLGKEKGDAPDYLEWAAKTHAPHRRNSHLMAIAPNASISILCGNTSPSIEPYNTNCVAQKTLNGTNYLVPKYLRLLIREKGLDELSTLKDIAAHEGSIQSLDYFTQEEKDLFKTSFEIDQRWVIEHAADRQKYVDQGQSVNIFIEPDSNKGFLAMLHYEAWHKGLKALYYCRSKSVRRAENITTKVERESYDSGECLSCEG